MTPKADFQFHKVHADWWLDKEGNAIHRQMVDGEELFYCTKRESHLPWDHIDTCLDGAKGYFLCASY